MLNFAALTTVNYATGTWVSIIFLIFFSCLPASDLSRNAYRFGQPKNQPKTGFQVHQKSAIPPD